MDTKTKKYITSLLFYRISILLKSKKVFRAKILVVKGLGKFVIGDLKIRKKYMRVMNKRNRKYGKKIRRIAKNKISKNLDDLL